jgi:hypothetical protein
MGPNLLLSSVGQVCNSSFDPLFRAEDLYIEHPHRLLVWKGNTILTTLWLRLLLPFTAVKNLYLSEEFAPGIAATLQELVGGRITEVLPSLENIFIEGYPEPFETFQENIGEFIIARQLSGYPLAVSFGCRIVLNREEEDRNVH